MKQLKQQDMRKLTSHQIIRGEQKMFLMKYSDPVSLNFKLLINYEKPYGLLADENLQNSALAYLLRIGENERYDMLKVWIQNLKSLIKDYEFLFLNVEGLDNIVGMKPGYYPTIDDKVIFTIRETVDLKIQSLFTNYHHIWYDDTRGVEVLPINLRRFDMSIVVFTTGYYNMLIYDVIDQSSNIEFNTPRSDIDKLIFPTINKLSDDKWKFENTADIKFDFNHTIFDLTDCLIDSSETGKTIFAEVSNEENTDIVKGNLVLNYKFCQYSGSYKNNFGTVNYGDYLALMSDLHKFQNVGSDEPFFKQLKDRMKSRVNDKFNSLTNVDNYKRYGDNLQSGVIASLEQKLSNLESSIFSKSSVTGDIWSKISLEYADQMIQNTMRLGINTLEDKVVNDPLTSVNNMLFNNYNSNIYDMFKRVNTPRNNTLIVNDVNKPERETAFNDAIETQQTQQGIRFEQRNIYNRNSL